MKRPQTEAYTIREVAALTGFSRQTVTRLFEHEPGVLIIAHPEQMHRRGYRSLRIPAEVFERMLRRLSVTLTENPPPPFYETGERASSRRRKFTGPPAST